MGLAFWAIYYQFYNSCFSCVDKLFAIAVSQQSSACGSVHLSAIYLDKQG